ncbi:glucose-6-phosphate exchanger SLC37A2 isoform X2 [Neocloeon triangulifer]|uniref:glucose-6-phosphate exchanger SLC37A2 isoform X2 n=1 Tax=Neocloeon triangulifer TaxID=2078957 RepID=UPI00286EEFA0|nr:glucose-6-phosphate exchanger SLC37A2 isoform X2 [Neocloeon triangulifer]
MDSPASLMDVPLGIRTVQWISRKCCPSVRINKPICYRFLVLILTYLAYTSYHLSRKPISVVKAVLNQNCSSLEPPPGVFVNSTNKNNWCDWAPFDGQNASALLGTLDSAFLFAYAAAMFVSGFVAERVNLRYFLSLGMIFSGIFCYMFGIAYSYNIHSISYLITVQVLGGIAQTTGWPGVVTVVGNWFGEGKRGLIFGIWNSHTSVGNILGSLVAGSFVDSDWALSFFVPALIMAGVGFIIFLFLPAEPIEVGCPPPERPGSRVNSQYRLLLPNSMHAASSSPQRSYRRIVNPSNVSSEEVTSDSEAETQPEADESNLKDDNALIFEPKAITFFQALSIPGVIEFSLSLFFAKLVSYTFLYWLPLYIHNASGAGAEMSADISAIFDIGGIFGGIAAGAISDSSGMSATTCAVMLILAVPSLFAYEIWGNLGLRISVPLLIVTGALVNGPYSLITTAVSAQLGTHPSLEGSSKALATVTAIIDGTGSIGAAVGPLLAGVISSTGWKNVFYMLMISDVLALVLLGRLVLMEMRNWLRTRAALQRPHSGGDWSS